MWLISAPSFSSPDERRVLEVAAKNHVGHCGYEELVPTVYSGSEKHQIEEAAEKYRLDRHELERENNKGGVG